MKKTVSLLLILGLLAQMCAFSVMAKEENIMTEIYVSSDGKSNGSGTKTNPFNSIEKAKARVRELNDNMTGDIVVHIAPGRYEITQTIRFTPEDSATNGYKIRYVSDGEAVLSGGKKVTGTWKSEGDGIYSVSFTRDKKLRSLYVNEKRAYMTEGRADGKGKWGTYSITKNQADWAWVSGDMAKGVKFTKGKIPFDTRNPDDIEIMTQTTWNTAIVCVDHLEDIGNNQIAAVFQMPYGAIAQKPSWNNSYQFNQGSQRIYNVFEWLDSPGEFYFDKSADKLYYYPREGEDMATARVVVPDIDTVVSIEGKDIKNRVKGIEFEGLTFAETDWQLYKVGSSYGRATVQGAAGMVYFADGNWHYSIYRAYDVGPGAVMVSNAENINFYFNTIRNTGNDGLSMVNDVANCIVDGNVFYDTAGSGVLIGHPQHTYIGDKNSSYGKESGKEKYAKGVEGACTKITFTNNLTYETARLFWGDAAVMVFHAADFVMRYNHIQETPYNGLSLGWNWWNMNGDSDAIVPGVPTTTNRNNTIEKNTFVKCMQTLGDAGAIYTLGDMTGTVINENYITNTGNPSLSQHIVRGIHPDEGTQHINAKNNLIEKMAKKDMAIIDVKYWGRKGNNTWLNTYTDNDLFESTPNSTKEPNTKYTRVVRESGIWGDDVFEIVKNAGIRGEYLKYMPLDIYSVPDRLLGASFYKKAGALIDLGIDTDDVQGEIWLAPSGTKAFKESGKITKARNGVVYAPESPGEYRLFVVNGNEISEQSRGRILVEDSLVGIEGGKKYSVSKEKPLDLGIKADFVTKVTLNGKEINADYKVTAEGEYILKITDLSGEVTEIAFGTYIDEVDKVFENDLRVIDGKVTLNASNKTVWFVPYDAQINSVSDLKEADDMTTANLAEEDYIIAPKKVGKYNLVLVDGSAVSKKSDAVLTVVSIDLDVTESLLMRLNANDITLKSGSAVSEWKDLVGGYDAVQSASANKPTIRVDEKGMKYLEFDGADDFLSLTSSKSMNLNSKKNLSIVVVSAFTGTEPKQSTYGDTKTAIYFGESGSWGSIFAAPYKSFVVTRFGSGQSNNVVKYIRESETDDFTVTAFTKDGKNEVLYENGEKVLQYTDRYETTANNKTSYTIGKTAASSTSYFEGKISEILIYDKTLTEDDVKDIYAYVSMKRVMGTIGAAIEEAEGIIEGGQGDAEDKIWQTFTDAYESLVQLRSGMLNDTEVSDTEIDAGLEEYQNIKECLYDNGAVATYDAGKLVLPKRSEGDITLLKEGALGSKIVWTSSMENVISNAGKVVRPGEESPTALVKLTASVSYGGKSSQRVFEVKVPAFVKKEKVWVSTADYSTYSFDKITKGAVSFRIEASELSDGVVALCGSDVVPDAWGDYPICVRIRPEGYFDARNADAFEYVEKLSYEVGLSYLVRVVIDTEGKTYSVYITDEDHNTYTIADSFEFRTSAPVTTDISKVTVRGGSGIKAGKFSVINFKAESGTKCAIVNPVYDGKYLRYICLADEDFSGKSIIADYTSEGLGKAKREEVSLKKGETKLFSKECIKGDYCLMLFSKDNITPLAVSENCLIG